MSQVTVYPGKISYGMFLTDLRGIERLRIDPQQYVGKSTLREINIFQRGLAPINFTNPQAFSSLQPLQQLKEPISDASGLHIVSTGVDPNFEFVLDLQICQPNWLLRGAELLFFFVVSAMFVWACAPLLLNFRFVPLLLTGALVLILAMSIVSKRNVHPDEYVHLAAVGYYKDHSLPPEIDDAYVRNTYSPYGVSRLNSIEIYYPLAGKFEKIISSFKIRDSTFGIKKAGQWLALNIRYYEIKH